MRSSKLIAFIFLSIFLLALVSAQDVGDDSSVIRFFGSPNDNLTIYEKCSVNGFACDSSYECNLTTIQTNNQEAIVLNQVMTRDQTIYSFLLNSTQNSNLGIYEDTVTCNNGTLAGTSTFYHRITPSGAPTIESGQGFTLVGTLILLILIVITLLIASIFIKNVPVSIFLVCLGILLMTATIGFGFTIMEEIFGLYGDLVFGYGIFYRLLVILITGFSMMLMLYLIVVGLKALQMKRGLRDEM